MLRSRIKSFVGFSKVGTQHIRALATKPEFTELSPCTREILENAPASNTEVEINGWISSSRISKNVAFLDIKDGTTSEGIQCVVRPPSLLPADIKNGAGIQVKGTWSEGKGKQKYEVQVNANNNGKIDVLGPVEELFPMIKKDHTLQYLRTIPEYRWRDPSLAAILRFRSQVETTLVNFFDSQMFTKTNPPLVTASDCEGAGELFRIESNSMIPKKEQFFGKEAFLTVSTQLHLEVLCAALNRVWTLSPCFRAEESDTNRHLSEFWMLEVEISFINHVSQLTKFSEKMIKSVVKNLVNNHNGMGSNLINTIDKSNVDNMTQRWNMLLSKDWDSITYTKAIQIIQEAVDSKTAKFDTRPNWGDSLKSEHEKWLAGTYFQNPVFVTDYPLLEKAFYMKINEQQVEGELEPTVACFDLLVPDIGELIGGSMREHDIIKLKKEIERRGMDVTPLNWYLKLRENGTVPHGGYGMGFERLLQYLSCTENIRDVIPFPRSVDNCLC
ncbi:asparaginyl-tRNA synthetase [Pichia californica]|uniref:Asparagine--tRNA ligase, mitochondrial n=1 Tax=Pichia californica TaxID=460514 RepID=A0A9P7BGL4_9ASCO|nr:asparaginyl-tRNA synthetase [[Candida] californica]KAG0690211.1 asparaginyl-tRNA synthetase [[Candida] californica]